MKNTRHKKKLRHDKRNDYLFVFLRWPLLVGSFYHQLILMSDLLQCFIFIFIMAEFGLYVFIRQLVNTKEWFTACLLPLSLFRVLYSFSPGRGEKGRLRKRLRSARTYDVRFIVVAIVRSTENPACRSGRMLLSHWTDFSISKNGRRWTRIHSMTGCSFARCTLQNELEVPRYLSDS